MKCRFCKAVVVAGEKATLRGDHMACRDAAAAKIEAKIHAKYEAKYGKVTA